MQDDLADLFEDMNEVNDLMGRAYGTPADLDDADLEAELEALGDEFDNEVGLGVESELEAIAAHAPVSSSVSAGADDGEWSCYILRSFGRWTHLLDTHSVCRVLWRSVNRCLVSVAHLHLRLTPPLPLAFPLFFTPSDISFLLTSSFFPLHFSLPRPPSLHPIVAPFPSLPNRPVAYTQSQVYGASAASAPAPVPSTVTATPTGNPYSLV